jgi:O-antigen/teichoic acid export membrane protein
MMLWTIAPVVLSGIPAMVVGSSLGLEQVTIYVVSSRVPMLVSMLAMRSFHAFFPKLQNLYVLDHRERFLRYYRVATSLSLLMTGAGLIIAMFANPYLVGFLARDDYYAGDSVTLWFALGFITIAVSEHLGCLFIIAGKGKLVSLVLAVEILIAIVAASVLCPLYGLVGVAAALALSPLVIRIPYYLIHGPRTCSFPTSALYGNATLALAASILMVAAAYLLGPTSTDPGSLRSGLTLALMSALLAIISSRRIWRDIKEIRVASA